MSAELEDVRRLLIITYHFPPDGAIGGQRWAGLSKYLARLGWEVHVVTSSAAHYGEEPSNVRRHTPRPRRTLNDLYKSAIGRVRSAGSSPNGRKVADHPAQRASVSWRRPLSAVRRILSSMMS